jgi:hypothetical protein
MAIAAPRIDEMFGGLPADQRVERFEAYKSALADCHARALFASSRGETRFVAKQGIIKTASVESKIDGLRSELVNKAMSPDQIADVENTLARLQDIQKDWTLTNPLSSSVGTYGLVPYDLDPALALLVPRSFILRNSISRIGGIGQAKEYRRILGVSNSNTGGVANQNTFFSSASAATAFGGTGGDVTLQRPSKISYAADRQIRSYVEQGVSDSVNFEAQYAGQGYTDIRQLSHTSLVWAHMLGEERNLLYGRSSGTGYVGALAAPASVTAAGTTGGSLTSGTTYYYQLTYSTGNGETVPTSITSTSPGGSNTAITFTPASMPAAALAINVYIGTVSGTWTNKFTSTSSSVTATAIGSGSYTAPSSDASANAYGYDGLVSVFTDTTQSGYVNRLNSTLSTTEPGKEFQDAFASLYSSVIADPEVILTTGAIRRELAKSIQQQGNPTGYRLNLEAGSDGVTIGSVVSAIANEYTGRMVDVIAHPYMPAGVALIWSKQLPFPDSGVAETTQVANVVDMQIIEWPTIQLSYDISSYQYGTMLHRAPAWSGAITGIQ